MAEIVDVLQITAFLCRKPNLLRAAWISVKQENVPATWEWPRVRREYGMAESRISG